jgi:hypothetical protein
MLAQRSRSASCPFGEADAGNAGFASECVHFRNLEIVAFDDISRRFRYSLAPGGGERRLLALIN